VRRGIAALVFSFQSKQIGQASFLGIDAGKVQRPVVCSQPGVEGVVIDHKNGTLLTLVN
jgi:hypothetical protein